MADRQPKLFVLSVAFFAAFFIQVPEVLTSEALTSTSIVISASVNASTVEVRFADNDTVLSDTIVVINSTSITIKWLHPGTLYNISVVNSSLTWELSTRPLKPTSITKRVTGTNVTIEWKFDNQKSGRDEWLIKYGSENEINYTVNSSLQSIQLKLSKDGTKYNVEIWTIANNVLSDTSLNTSFVTDPNALSNAAVKTNGRNITVTWVERPSFTYTACLTNVPICLEKENTNTHTFTNLVAGKSYNLSIIVHSLGRNSSEYSKTIILRKSLI
uniref:Fibronectin type-III domain-containing protein n=1 Tax=Octopus bimaculoides TaxID=37653 RepID=A0A0L8FGK6_OCTBM